MSGRVVKSSHASREDKLETIRWYLTGHLDSQTELTGLLATAVNAYEYLRHAIELVTEGDPLEVPMRRTGACVWLSRDLMSGRWLRAPEFPQLPFTKLSTKTRESVLSCFDAEYPAFYPADITELEDWGVLEALVRLAENSRHSKERVTGEVEVFGQTVVPFTVNFGSGIKSAERWFKRWIKENEHRFAKGGRSLAGARARDNPRNELKDLAAARLLSLHNFDRLEASKWTWKSQPLDSDGQPLPWFNMRRVKTRCHLFKDLRDWTRTLNRFEKNLLRYLVSQ